MLASRSPQRRAILTQLGIPFEVCPADVEELSAGEPARVAVENARRKALALAGSDAAAGRTILGVDTIVVLDGDAIHGKPADAAAARTTLAALGGREHLVLSGIAVLDAPVARAAVPSAAADAASADAPQQPRTALATTRVRFRHLDDATLDWYVATGEWEGRAGGYAIQGRGAALVAAIDGDYLNVVGLPVAALLDLLPGIVQEVP
ncbi:nucleoside triphosphate pyrophosphatase [Conexibacter sp. CPCC 206217]|uniref:Maf family protein n=1 Tax=Conexibacter sp. CPCC 206217 TaxID=3064574 RepID=UPI0027268606|nr:Maf family protein [Conexibacter sp. CPCC 206217]MDO8213928.1 Maf family protein [Conexibacter sp. CPCC 206217]